MNCTNCNAHLMDGDMFCPVCGAPAPQPNEGVFCANCGTELFSDDAFCPTCGKKVDGGAQPSPSYVPPPSYGSAPVASEAPKESKTGLVIAIIMLAVALLIAAVTGGIMLYNTLWGDNGDDNSRRDNRETPQPTEVAYSVPVFDYAEGSTTRGYDVDDATGEYCYYYEEYVMDDDITTAWTPNRHTDPMPTMTLRANEKQHVSGIRMSNGYCKSEKTYTRNSRITKVRITYSGGETIAEMGIDNYRVMIDIPFEKAVDTDYITIHVLDTYYGDWEDVAISEIEVY